MDKWKTEIWASRLVIVSLLLSTAETIRGHDVHSVKFMAFACFFQLIALRCGQIAMRYK